MLSIGAVNLGVNIIILAVLLFAEALISSTLLNFATSHLITTRSAPVVHETDTRLPFVALSVIKYRKHPGMSAMLLSCVYRKSPTLCLLNCSPYLPFLSNTMHDFDLNFSCGVRALF